MSRWAVLAFWLLGCGPLLGNPPPRPPPPEGPTAYDLPPIEAREGGEIVLTARDMAAAEEVMKRRCDGAYQVSFVGTAEGTSCRGPVELYSSRTNSRQARAWRRTDRYDESPRNTSRCSTHQDVRVHYRCG